MSPQASLLPTAAVLAGGLGTRIGGDKALAELGGRALIIHVIDAAHAAGLEVTVVAKSDTRLPALDVPVLEEPAEPRHPFTGVVTALRRHPAVLAVPCDMPFLPPALLGALAACETLAAAGTVAGRMQPFPALYRAGAQGVVEAVLRAQAPVRAALEQLAATPVDVGSFGDPERSYLTVNTPADLERAAQILRG